MIIVPGNIVTSNNIVEYPRDTMEFKIIDKLSLSEEVYEYTSLNQLKFEINLRRNIISAAREVNSSGIRFRTFKNSICNAEFWDRTDKGGFLLRKNISPSEGIKDIFINGPKYGTECSTIIVIIFYKALLGIYPEELFNITFPDIHLLNWHYIDDDLSIATYKNLSDYIPGDCRYIDNPDFNPEHPEWRGENVIDLGDETYFAHGIGMVTKDYIIEYLNNRRKPDATQPAFLKESATRPAFRHLSNVYLNYIVRQMWDLYGEPRLIF